MAEMVDYCVRVPSDETPRIQECHILIGHILCAAVEKELFEKQYRK
jgi:D-sedoheptulose 7-phosphate isomerase